MKRLRDWTRTLWLQPTVQGVTVRPLHSDDAGLIHAMHQRLSPESVYDRYLQYRHPTLTDVNPPILYSVVSTSPTSNQGCDDFVTITAYTKPLAHWV